MNKSHFNLGFACVLMCLTPWPAVTRADDNDEKPAATSAPVSLEDARFGIFGWLDKRSAYYHDKFPEPFRVEDTAIDNEFRLDWQHTEGRGGVSNQVLADVQKSIGIMTFEIQAPYVLNPQERNAGDVSRQDGIGTIELGGRIPVYQFFSASGGMDNTIGFDLEIGVPTNSRVSKNTAITPGIFDDLRIGNHFTIQSLFGLSSLLGSTPDEGRELFEYGLAFGYTVEDEEFALPNVERLTPIVEFVGETALSGRQRGHNTLTATAGIRLELKPIGQIQPQFGVAYLFPIDQGGREDLRWGIITSFVFEL